MVRGEWSREDLPRQHWQQERFSSELQDVRRPPMGIDQALRESCNIPAAHYFVAAILDDGSPAVFAGPGAVSRNSWCQFFNQEEYIKFVQRSDAVLNPPFEDEFGFEGDTVMRSSTGNYAERRLADRRLTDMSDHRSDINPQKGRKRARALQPMVDDEDVVIPMSKTKRGIKVGSSAEIWQFYEQRFKNCQQTACKLMAKAWVKAVEPKKQSNHPYTGSDEKAPDWWPKPWGPTKDDRVRHKEPDHLYKRERVHLLCHILRMVVEPKKFQHPDIQKVGLNVKKLEEITMEALSSFLCDKDSLTNAKKKPYINEIFNVARYEERYKNEEIDATTEVFVIADDKIPEGYQHEADESVHSRDDDGRDPVTISSSASPAKASVLQPSSNDHSPAGNIQSAPFLGELPVRGSHYPTHMMAANMGPSNMTSTGMGPEHHHFVEGMGMPPLGTNGNMSIQVAGDIMPSPHDASRRPSLFNSPSDYASPAAPTMYNQPWPPTSAAPTMASMYAFPAPQGPPPSAAYVAQPTVALPPTQQSLRSEGLPAATPFDIMSSGNPFRTPNSVSQAQVPHSPGYPHYLSHDGRSLPTSSIKVEPQHRGPIR